MAKKPLPLSVSAEGRFEGFAPIRRDFKMTIENKSSATITGGVITAQWADPHKPAERWVPENSGTNHAFGPGPNMVVVNVESDESYWAGVIGVEGFSGLTLSLLDKQ